MAFAKMHPEVELRLAEDGVEGLDVLRGRYSETLIPNIVLLDLNMPRLNGFETLAAIRGDPQLRALPVVMLTSSDDEADVQRCYEAGANTYMVKPVTRAKFESLVSTFSSYWFNGEFTAIPNSPKRGP